LEQNLSRLEETSFILPQVEQRVQSLENLHKRKIEAFELAAHMLRTEVDKILSSLNPKDPVFTTKSKRDSNCFVHSSFLDTSLVSEIPDFAQEIHPDKIIRPLIRKLIKHFYINFSEKFSNQVIQKVN